MTRNPRISSLVAAIRGAVDDPLSAESIQRLWRAEYAANGADRQRLNLEIEQSLGSIAGQAEDGTAHPDLARTLERFRHAALVVRYDGRIEAMNAEARRAISADPGDSIDDIGYEPMPLEPLSSAIGWFLDPSRNSARQVNLWQSVTRCSGRTATLAVVQNGARSKTALVFVIDPVWRGKAEAMARRSFGLTGAETGILAAFLNGRSLREIADERGSAHATVRTQFHSIMLKFGVGTQAELVRSALGLSQFIADVEPVAQVALHPDRRRFNVLRPGGRSIEVFVAGDAAGSPVIFLPDCTLYTFAAPIEARFREAGLAVVSAGRPAFGATDPPPEGCDDLGCIAADVEAVLAQLDAGPAVVAAHCTSGVFAFALAAKRPDLVRRVVIFGGTVPRPFLDADRVGAPFASALLRARDASPRLFRLILRASSSAWRRLGARRFNAMNLARSDADSAISRSEACVEEFEHALEAQFASGYDRFEADMLIATTDWSDHVRRCTVPAMLLQGVEDPVTSIADVRKFAAANGNLVLKELAACGFLLHHTDTPAFIRALVDDDGA